MEEIEYKGSSIKNKRLHKKSTRVDLTPMVDLGFLLITFFVFTTQMSLPKTIGLVEPENSDSTFDPVCNSCVLTLILDKDNVIHYYEGTPENNPVARKTFYAPDGIRKILSEKKEKVRLDRGMNNQFVLIIKPGDASTMQNFVDIVDEVTINDIKRYYIAAVDDTDMKILWPKINL